MPPRSDWHALLMLQERDGGSRRRDRAACPTCMRLLMRSGVSGGAERGRRGCRGTAAGPNPPWLMVWAPYEALPPRS